MNLFEFIVGYVYIIYLYMYTIRSPDSTIGQSDSLEIERSWVRVPLWVIIFHFVILALFAWLTPQISQYK